MSDNASETALLEAVRNRLRTQLSLPDDACEIEFDEMAPATTGDTYLVVLPGGVTDGPAHKTSGQVIDEVIGVDVTVVRRATAVPRDRHRDVYLRNLTSLNDLIQQVRDAIDFKYEVNIAANAIISGLTGSQHGFIEPLKFAGMDKRPRKVSADFFAASKEPVAGLARTVNFRGARRMQAR